MLPGVLLSTSACQRSRLPPALTDNEFWSLIESLSEPAGTFSLSDNFVSNEPRFAENVSWLRPTGGVYIGVGPEQNFSYIARLRPAMAFIVDIRRENRNLHLLYKALFELSTDRAEFVSRLFSAPSGWPGVGRERRGDFRAVRPRAFFPRAYSQAPPSCVSGCSTRGLPLSESGSRLDRSRLQSLLHGRAGHPVLGSAPDVDAVRPSYRELMTGRTPRPEPKLPRDGGSIPARQGSAVEEHDRPCGRRLRRARAIRRVGDYVRERETSSRVLRVEVGSI